MTFRADVEQIWSTSYGNTYEQGASFEKLLTRVLPQRPELELTECWRREDAPLEVRSAIPTITSRDQGVDLLARRNDGGIVAVQAKCFRSKSVQRTDVDPFFANTGGNMKLDSRMLITTSDWSDNITDAYQELLPPITLINSLSEWGDWSPEQSISQKVLNARQREAVEKCVSGLLHSDRGKLIMACGGGKTLISLRVAEELTRTGGVILFAAPSLTLVSQARKAWLEDTDSDLPMHSVVVCSRGERGRDSWRANSALTIDAPATTDPIQIAERVKRANELGGRVAVFSTYQSIDRICEAQREHGLCEIDLCISDEAHRTTGALFDDEEEQEQLTKCFQLIHNGLAARKRLYQTATPRIFHERTKAIVQHKAERLVQSSVEIVDMDDDIYGHVFDQLDFAQALEEMPDRMCDYKIVILLSRRGHGNQTIERSVVENSETEGVASTSLGARLAGLNLAIHGAVEELWNDGGDTHVRSASIDIRSLIGFCNTRAKARWAAKALQTDGVAEWAQDRAERLSRVAPDRRPVKAQFIDGIASPTKRREILDTLHKHRSGSARAVVMNAKLLTEGVDIPALDAICFLEDRKSEVDIVQAVGRVMRKVPGKERGYIIVPVELGEESSLDFEEELAESVREGRILGQVLRALRAHDPRIQTQLHERIVIVGPTNERNGNPIDSNSNETKPWTEQLLAQGKFDNVAMGLSRETGLGTPARDVANLIEGAVLRASQKLEEEGLRNAMAETLAMDKHASNKSTSPCTVGAVILMNAALVHQRIVETGGTVVPARRSIEELRSSGKLDEELIETWTSILDYDYEPIFRKPIELLDRIRREYAGKLPQGARQALRILSDKAIEVANRYVEMGMDHAGQLYQRVMGNVASDGAYFTLPNAARVLSGLAMNASSRESPDQPLWQKGTIVDPACGSGTLLLGMLTAIKESDDSDANTHRTLVEDHLGGMDINPQSVQLAACQLTVGDPSVQYRRMNLWTVPLGPQGSGTRTGSMDFLAELALKQLNDFDPRYVTSGKREQGLRTGNNVDTNASSHLKDARMIVMNPPYTIGEQSMTKLDPLSRNAFQEQMKAIREVARKAWPTDAGVVSKKTLRPLFTLLACKSLSQHNEGVLAKIMPFTACTSGAGIEERRFLARELHIEIILTLHNPKSMNWSSETDINESILIGRRSTRNEDTATRFINLVRRPESIFDCDRLIEDIERGDVSAWGSEIVWPNERMRKGRWSAAVWYDPELSDLYETICNSEGSQWQEHLTLGSELGYEVFQTGPALGGKGWSWTSRSNRGAIPVLWSSGSNATRTLRTVPDRAAIPAGATERAVSKMNERRSHLLVPKTQDSGSGRLMAVVAHRKMVGDKWLVICGPTLQEAKAQSIWLNSTPGRIAYMSEAARKLTWPLYGKEGIERTPVVDTRNAAITSQLAACYDRTCNKTIPQYRDGIQPVRELWDDSISTAFDLDREEIRRFADKLSKEPKVVGPDNALMNLRK